MTLARRIVVAIVAFVVLLGGGLVASRITIGPVHAVAESYSAHWVLRSSAMQRCATFDVRGTVTATRRATLVGGTAWSRIRVRDPVLVATSGCDGQPAWTMAAGLHQDWYSAGCGLRVDFPATDDAERVLPCAADRVAVFASDEGPSTAPLRQANSGNPAVFADAVLLPWQSLALRGRIGAAVRHGGSSDATERAITVDLNR